MNPFRGINFFSKNPLCTRKIGTLAMVCPSKPKNFCSMFMVKIVKETLNRKQQVGIGMGIVAGFAIFWPLMTIIFDGLLTPYFQSFTPSFSSRGSRTPVNPTNITEGVTRFNYVINFYTLMAFVGLPMGIDAASETQPFLGDLTAESTSSFSIQKTKAHWWTLLCAKSGIYFFLLFLPAFCCILFV